MLADSNWITEYAEKIGTAFSLKLGQKLHTEQTPYQKLEVYATSHFGNLMLLDDYIMLSQRDNFIYHEMLSHPVLFSHPAPKSVVIIGGGDCGTLREVLKHSVVESVQQIEIDERVTRISEQYFPELCESNQDPRAQLLFTDGIAWMQQAKDNSIDIIIVDSADPVGPGEGLFQLPFYQDCLRVLRPNGLLVQQSESPLVHWQSIMQPMQQAMRNAGFIDVKPILFPQPVYPTGWWSATLASKSNNIKLTRAAAAANPGFSTDYYNLAIHQAAFAQPNFCLR